MNNGDERLSKPNEDAIVFKKRYIFNLMIIYFLQMKHTHTHTYIKFAIFKNIKASDLNRG